MNAILLSSGREIEGRTKPIMEKHGEELAEPFIQHPPLHTAEQKKNALSSEQVKPFNEDQEEVTAESLEEHH